ncbi:MAG: endonuclease domain-containing protein [Bacillota bacterium]
MDSLIDRALEGDEVSSNTWRAMDPRVKEAVRQLASSHAVTLVCEIEACESPIEQLLGLYLCHFGQAWIGGDSFILNPQQEVDTPAGRFRVDFLVAAEVLGRKVCLAVECDGHDYHEKTKAQAARDKRRDRALKLAGFEVVHFTGTEIWADPERCAVEVFRHLRVLAERK